MENNKLNRKSFIIGFILAVVIILSISAVGNVSEVGRYQIAASENASNCFVIDTTTGAVTFISYRDTYVTRENFVDGQTVQGLLNQ